ncbi:MAG: Txe/YoeB family addiction module toxin [Bacteroidota bacterium]
MQLAFMECGGEDHLYWQQHNKKILKKVNELIKQCQRTPFEGIGKPEPLKNELSGWWSRRIDKEHRLVYRVEKSTLYVAQCRHHY